MIKILIVDDSISVRQFFTEFFSREPDFEVVGCAEDGESALRMVRKLKPDVVTMDVNLPDYDGFVVTRLIMEQNPVPIVIISAVYSASDAELGFKMLDTGALAFHNKPAINDKFFNEKMAEIIMSVRLMSEVKVVRRRIKLKKKDALSSPEGSDAFEYKRKNAAAKIVCIGASTGGPQAVKQVLLSLPNNFNVPVLIVQHISTGFLEGMVNWLSENTGHNVKIVAQNEILQAGVIYFAPEDHHIQISSKRRVSLSKGPAVNGICPTIAELFSSAAENLGDGVVGVLLTGMGRDGAEGLLDIRRKGGYTIAQDKETSIIFGMPGEAVKLGAAVSVLPLEKIGEDITRYVLESYGEER
ncbi:chemotaxis-specific protein-glutamate methyltransferase CheB [Maridesulfovibrio ferrireducens]|uniref:chemotaxis-specific protein-glutamate methyltransferase CheB n=1 Tax=Maridesulfovibrio ferrireducens TaxID=246191 RepID=UPI001A1E5D64|nr:chemotaxis-specific protein-glutamate methyltransferase CheB [Maridesulfovibrio ferrireducens]MBI9112861.1 chemotaxis-specific protein-glutamate methyltransferase CheB [Maridesulfovibrio ferrireducens]